MKQLIGLSFMAAVLMVSSCTKEHEKKKDWVKVDFTGSSGHSIVTFTGEHEDEVIYEGKYNSFIVSIN